jgi:hypothetical protein
VCCERYWPFRACDQNVSTWNAGPADASAATAIAS